MIVVGDYLADTAIKQSDDLKCDLFGRSAFNRYYYSTYLLVKENISKINPSWGTMNHKDLPKVLKGEIVSLIKKDIKRIKGHIDYANSIERL